MAISFVLLAVGLVLVVKGADFLVNGASSLAKRMAVPEIVIGLTIVAFGTSAPELVVNVFSSISGKSELVLGNIIGSNVFNTLFILGIAGLIYPLEVQQNSVRKEIPFSLLAAVILFILANDYLIFKGEVNRVTRIDGLILLVLFGGFIYYTFGLSKIKPTYSHEIKLYSLFKTWIFIIIGFAGLFLGGKLMVDNAVSIARKLQVSEKLIGLTIVAVGTSLPELATSAVAAFKKRYDLAVGNVVGSNIFNILFILGVSAQISPVHYSTAFNLDLYIFALGTLLLFAAMFTGKSRKLDRWEALILLVTYILYTIYIIVRK
ncbi:MAG: calcium/sodium antiporter [Candidatus Aminicenantes bacterium]|nr:calcium/sodium antiporter [Candidatus Aminicenantes bacterium]NIM80486.1 calcium/sodium antiporter [Candidatus Aminicenantes bacterium]NIN23928.1 calcium/sodium antiporter [Candidatus Aminicenantes bacterium]NIN47642.1 calcium/sodium antiporter [Candidatus Aminicenantes bacterium]NIN90572.1 calcium/sodium antiporter [Candidatus Aminicenantes bacterium]